MYKDLSLKEKAKVIREGVRLGLNSIDDILSLYDEAISYLQGGPIVSPYDNYIPDNNGYRNDPNVVTGNKYLILDFEGRGYVPLVGDMNKPIGYFSNAGERGVLYPGELKNVLGSMVYEHPLIGNLALEGKKFNRQRLSDNEYFSIMEKVAEENNSKWNEDRKKRNQRLLSVDEELVRLLNSNDYDYRGYYTKYPNSKANADTHWTDEFKTVYHPTFSEESRYSGIIDRNYNPYGYIGGSWGNNDEFIPATWLIGNQFQLGGLAKPFSYGDIPDVRYLKGGNLFLERGFINRIKPIEEYITPLEPVITDNTAIVLNPVYTPQEKSYAAALLAFYERHKSPEAEKKASREARLAVKDLKAAEFGTLDVPLSNELLYKWRKFNNAKGSELLEAAVPEFLGIDVADKLYSGNYGDAAKDLALYGAMTYAPEILNIAKNYRFTVPKNPNRYYRIVDKRAIDDYANSGIIRSAAAAKDAGINTGDDLKGNVGKFLIAKNHDYVMFSKGKPWEGGLATRDKGKPYILRSKKNTGNTIWEESNIDFGHKGHKGIYRPRYNGSLDDTPSYFFEYWEPLKIGYMRHEFPFSKGGPIHIKPENRGKFTALKKRTGHSASWFKAHGTPALRKMATFELNARHWKHLDGGYSDRLNNLNWKMHHSAGSDNIGSVWYNYTFDPENNYYNGTHYVGQNLLGKTQEQLPLGRDHVNLYTYGDETGFERINNATPITVNGETYDYRLYYGNILPFDTIYLKPESLPVVDSMIKHKDLLGVNTDYFIMDLNDAETYPKQYKNVFSHKNIKKGMPLDDTRAVSISPKKDENGYYLDAFDVIDYKKTTGFAGNRLDKIVEKENILNGPYILRQRVPVVFDKNKESNGPLLNLISQYKDNGMTWEEYLMKYSPSYNRIYGRHNQDAVSIEHKRSKGGHLFLENGYLQEAPKTFVVKQYDINLPLDWNAESWLGERADNYKGPKYTDEDIKIFESHVPEYRLIEENARNNGTWLKMSDGTTWHGDPRDWVLMQSKAFKNNYEDKVWYTGLAEWPTTVNYNGQDIQTDKVKRARYHNGLMWFSDNPGYALYFADYVDLKGLNSREWQHSPNGGYEKAPYINGMVFTAAIPKNSEIHSLLAPKEGTHDLWQKMPYVLTETGIERIPEYKLHQNKKGRNLINDDILDNKLITDDLVNHAENLGWKGLYMFNVDDGPVFINKPDENYIPQESLHLEGVDTSRGTINEFISLPGLTEKLKFIHGNNGDFNPNIEDKYSYLTKDNYGNLIKFGGKIKK